MEQFSITATTKGWFDLTHEVLELKKIPSEQLQDLLKDTYKILYFYHRQDCAPKMVSKLLLEMDEFLYFVSLLEDNEEEKKRVATEYHNYPLHQILQSLYIAFRSYFDIADYAKTKGIDILNITPDSFIDAFPRLRL
jgi:hypothetical protein